jgi:calcium-dependent protein kinase
LHEFFRDWHFFYLVSDLCEDGDLIDRIKTTLFNEVEAAKIMKQVLSGVNYLHKNGIVHRDLKPENIMFDSGVLKILDFGISSTIKRGYQLHKVAGTVNELYFF